MSDVSRPPRGLPLTAVILNTVEYDVPREFQTSAGVAAALTRGSSPKVHVSDNDAHACTVADSAPPAASYTL